MVASCETCNLNLFLNLSTVTGPLTSPSNELLYETFSVRFQAGRSLRVNSGYYAEWVIREHSVPSAPAHSRCSRCHNYCYHGYEHEAESCASSCQCVARVNTGRHLYIFTTHHVCTTWSNYIVARCQSICLSVSLSVCHMYFVKLFFATSYRYQLLFAAISWLPNCDEITVIGDIWKSLLWHWVTFCALRFTPPSVTTT